MQISKNSKDRYILKTKEVSIMASADGIEIEGLKFTGPGEYERKGVFVEGIRPDGEGTIFVLHAEDISICFLGKVSKLLSADAVKALGDIDILFVPMGEEGSMKPADAVKTIATIDPRLVIPIFYGSEINFETALSLKPEEVSVLKIKKTELPIEDRKLILI